MPVADRHHALALTHYESAESFLEEGKLALAMRQFALTAEVLQRTSDPPLQQHAWTRAGVCGLEIGEVETARGYLQEGVALARQHHLDSELAMTLGQLAAAHRRLGAPQEAAAALREAIDIADRLGDGLVSASMAAELGELEQIRGALGAAKLWFERAYAALGDLGETAAQANVAISLGELARAAGEDLVAEDRFRDALRIFGADRDAIGNARALANLGHLARDAGKLTDAHHLYDASLRMASFGGDRAGVACAVQNLGNLAASHGDLALAQDQYESALELYEELGDVQSIAGLRVNLANLAATGGKLEEARDAYVVAIAALERVRAARAVVDVRCLIGQLEARLGRLDAAETAFIAAKREADALGYGPAQARLGVNLAAVGYARGDIGAGVSGFQAGAAHLESLGRPADAATTWLAAADAMLAAGRPDDAGAAVGQARALLGEGEEKRELIDCDVVAGRVALSQAPSIATREDMLALADRLALGGREADALAARLIVVDLGVDPPRDRPLADAVTRGALALGVAPLALDAESAALALDPAPTDAELARARFIAKEAVASGLALLRLRAERRLAIVLGRTGHTAEAESVRADATQRARSMGAAVELARLVADAR